MAANGRGDSRRRESRDETVESGQKRNGRRRKMYGIDHINQWLRNCTSLRVFFRMLIFG